MSADLPPYQRARRELILAAASTLLESQSYEQIQMRDVATSARVAIGTLYRYFPSKDQLYAEVLINWANPVRQDPERPQASAEARIRSKLHLILAAFHERPEFFKLLDILRTSNDHTAATRLDEFNSASKSWLLEEMAMLGEQSAHDFAQMLWAVLVSAVSESIYHDDTAQDARRIVDRFIDMIGPRLAFG